MNLPVIALCLLSITITGCSGHTVQSTLDAADDENCQIRVVQATASAAPGFVSIEGDGTIITIINGKACPPGDYSMPHPRDHSRTITVDTRVLPKQKIKDSSAEPAP